MSFLRNSAVSGLRSRAAAAPVRQPFIFRSICSSQARFAQGYGDEEGDPKGANPQKQGSSNSTKRRAEHPGPSPPKVGKGTGGGPTKAGGKSGGGKSPEVALAASGGARSKDAKETGSSPTGGDLGQGGGKTSNSEDMSKGRNAPKIHDQSEPDGGKYQDKEAEVRQHNKEFYEGHDRASESPSKDKVDTRFWEGLVAMKTSC